MELSNYQKLENLTDSLDPVETAFMIERLLLVAQLTKKSINEEPEKWQNGFISPALYVKFCDKIEKHLSCLE